VQRGPRLRRAQPALEIGAARSPGKLSVDRDDGLEVAQLSGRARRAAPVDAASAMASP
jgi:hypothetical protein